MEPRDDDMAGQIRKWLENRKPCGQAIVRCLTREEVEDRVPDTLRPHIEVEDYGGVLLVKASEGPGAMAFVQRLAVEDSGRVVALAAALASDDEIGSGDRDNDALDPGGGVGGDGAFGVEHLPGAQPDGLELAGRDDEHVPDGEGREVGGEGRDRG